MNFAILIKEKVWMVVREQWRAEAMTKQLLERGLPTRWEQTDKPVTEQKL